MIQMIVEHPHTSHEIAMFARRKGVYDRPILGNFTDLRLEDMKLPNEVLLSVIGPLPPIPEVGQIGKYFVATFGNIDQLINEQEAQELMATGYYHMLPGADSPNPWWEWSLVVDAYNGYIKAPKVPRPGEPSAEEIDEILDQFPQNQGTINVLSPTTLRKMEKKGIRDDYRRKLAMIH